VERNRPALADGEILLRHFLHVLGQVFDDRELDSFTDLRRCESYAGRSVEGFAHGVNKLLNALGGNFLRRKRSRLFTQNGFAYLEQVQQHAVSACERIGHNRGTLRS
jgi:hypothetical protein